MNGRIAALGLCLLVLLAAACSKDEPVAQPPSAPASTSTGAGLPTGDELTPVDVTMPATPTSIDPQLLPPNARKASAMAGLTTEQRICIDDTIYETVQLDPTIADDQGRLAGVMGAAMAQCGGTAFATTAVAGLKEALQLTDAQSACIESAMAGDRQLAAQFLGAIATADFTLVLDAIEPFETRCAITVPGS